MQQRAPALDCIQPEVSEYAVSWLRRSPACCTQVGRPFDAALRIGERSPNSSPDRTASQRSCRVSEGLQSPWATRAQEKCPSACASWPVRLRWFQWPFARLQRVYPTVPVGHGALLDLPPMLSMATEGTSEADANVTRDDVIPAIVDAGHDQLAAMCGEYPGGSIRVFTPLASGRYEEMGGSTILGGSEVTRQASSARGSDGAQIGLAAAPWGCSTASFEERYREDAWRRLGGWWASSFAAACSWCLKSCVSSERPRNHEGGGCCAALFSADVHRPRSALHGGRAGAGAG